MWFRTKETEKDPGHYAVDQMKNSQQPDVLRVIRSLEDYPQFIIGVLQIVNGVASLAFGIAAACLGAAMTGWSGVGIWCGIVFFIHGLVTCRCSAGQKIVSKVTVKVQMVLGYVTGAFSIVQLAIASSGIYNDVYKSNPHITDYNQQLPSPREYQLQHLSHTAVVSGMLLMFAVISGTCCFWSTFSSCRGLYSWCANIPAGPKQLYLPAFTSKCFAIAQITIGFLSMGFGVASIAVHSRMGYAGAGLWCGVMYTVAGVFGYLAGVKKTKSMVIISLVLACTSGLFAAAQLSLSAVGVSYYYYNNCYSYNSYNNNIDRERCNDLFSVFKGKITAMDVMVLMLAVAEGFCLTVTAVIACKACCKCCNKKTTGTESVDVAAISSSPVTTQSPAIIAGAPQTSAPGMAPPAFFMYQNGVLVAVPVVYPTNNTNNDTIAAATSQIPQATAYPQMLGVMNPVVNPQHPDTVEPRTTGEEEKNGAPRTPPPSYRSTSDLTAAVHNPNHD